MELKWKAIFHLNRDSFQFHCLQTLENSGKHEARFANRLLFGPEVATSQCVALIVTRRNPSSSSSRLENYIYAKRGKVIWLVNNEIHPLRCSLLTYGFRRFLCTLWHDWRTPTSRHLFVNQISAKWFPPSREREIFHRCHNHSTEFDGTWHNNSSSVMEKLNDPIYHSYQSIFYEAVVGEILKNTQPITSWFCADSWLIQLVEKEWFYIC